MCIAFSINISLWDFILEFALFSKDYISKNEVSEASGIGSYFCDLSNNNNDNNKNIFITCIISHFNIFKLSVVVKFRSISSTELYR